MIEHRRKRIREYDYYLIWRQWEKDDRGHDCIVVIFGAVNEDTIKATSYTEEDALAQILTQIIRRG